MKAVAEKIRKYYKYVSVEEDWVRPNLSSNGTLGGNSFACGGSYYHTSYGNSNIYQLFDGNTGSGVTAVAYNGGGYITFYNPEPIRVTSIKNDHIWYGGDWYDVTIYGSDDNYNWTNLGYFNHGLTTACNITNPQYFKYYRLYNNSGFGHDGSGYGGGLTELYITAKIGGTEIVETDETDYDFYKDVYEYSLPAKTERKYYKYDMENPVSNVDIIGTLSNDDGVLSGFSSGNYAKLPNVFSHGSNSWAVQFKVTTGSDVSSQGCICEQLYSSNYYGLTVYIQSGTLRVRCGNGSSIFWDVDTSYPISANTMYWVKAEFTGSQYILTASTDGENWTTASTINSSTISTDNYSMNIGRRNYSATSPWLGSIDLKESYIKVNNKIWWEGVTYPIIDGTEQDYDFYKDINTYKAIKSYEKGQYYGN